MARARVHFVQGATRTTFTYNPPFGWFSPRAWLWCIVGGLPVGIAAALVTRIVIDYPLLLRAVFAGATILGAGALYALYIVGLQRLALRVTFDRAQRQIGYRRVNAPRWTWYPWASVEGFRLERSSAGAPVACTLVMDTRSTTLTLIQVRQDCYAQSGLPHLITRLNLQLAPSAEDDLPEVPSPLLVAPPGAFDEEREAADDQGPPPRFHEVQPPDVHD